jgi:monoamine oxidase
MALATAANDNRLSLTLFRSAFNVERHVIMNPARQDTEFTVIGAGVSGLACALLLVEAGRTVHIIEANGTAGGRIRSVFDDHTGEFVADLGPTWIWPAYQPVINQWLQKLGLETFVQFDVGHAIIDHGPGTQPDARMIPGQAGNMRIVGGSQALIDRLAARVPKGELVIGSPATSVSINADGCTVNTGNSDGGVFQSERLIVAAPPRIVRDTIVWHPHLPADLASALEATPTWMAPHAKVVALYDTPFWRHQGLSGRIASSAGPIVEGHDHSGPEGFPAAIFGFIGWPHDVRAGLGTQLEAEIRAQLARCFGKDSPQPVVVHIEDWAGDRRVASQRDVIEPMAHPDIASNIVRLAHLEGRMRFAGAETAQRSPGLIEGALDAAEQTVAAFIGSSTDNR